MGTTLSSSRKPPKPPNLYANIIRELELADLPRFCCTFSVERVGRVAQGHKDEATTAFARVSCTLGLFGCDHNGLGEDIQALNAVVRAAAHTARLHAANWVHDSNKVREPKYARLYVWRSAQRGRGFHKLDAVWHKRLTWPRHVLESFLFVAVVNNHIASVKQFLQEGALVSTAFLLAGLHAFASVGRTVANLLVLAWLRQRKPTDWDSDLVAAVFCSVYTPWTPRTSGNALGDAESLLRLRSGTMKHMRGATSMKPVPGATAIVEALLTRVGFDDPNKQSRRATRLLPMAKCPHTAQMLLSHKADVHFCAPHTRWFTALHARVSQPPVIAILIRAKARLDMSPRVTFGSKMTALHKCVLSADVAKLASAHLLVRAMIKAGMPLNLRDRWNRSAMWIANSVVKEPQTRSSFASLIALLASDCSNENQGGEGEEGEGVNLLKTYDMK
jgi:hypothetical protein